MRDSLDPVDDLGALTSSGTSREGRGPTQVRKILIMVENLPVPLDRRVWMEATTLVEAGYGVSIISPMGRGWDTPYEVIDGVHVYRFPEPPEAHSGNR